MIIAYTEHAKSRMKHRSISKSVVQGDHFASLFTVPSRLGRFIAVNKYEDKYLKVICEKVNDKITVVTVYWKRRP